VQLQKVDPPNQVIDAFRDVQSAKIDQQRLINEAESYRNNVVPVAHGDGARIVQEAEAYRQQVVLNAQGDAARFLSVYQSYKAAPDITARRLYIETMQDILQHTNKIILDKSAASSGVVPYLPLPQLREMAPPPVPQPNAPPLQAPPSPRTGGR
jgi:membrane protease subunit HflK